MSRETNLSRAMRSITDGVNLAWQFGGDPTKVSHCSSWASAYGAGVVPSPKHLALQSIQNVAFREASKVIHGRSNLNGMVPHPSVILRAMTVAMEAVEAEGLIGSLAIATDRTEEVAPEWNAERIRYRNGTLRAGPNGFSDVIRIGAKVPA